MRDRFLTAAVAVLLVVVVGQPAVARGRREAREERERAALASNATIDYLGVAAVMIRDGNYDRAQNALEQVDLTAEGVDLARFFTLSGLVALRQGEYETASDAFQFAQESGQDDPVINVYLTQAYYAQGLYHETIDSIAGIPNLNQYSDLYGVLAESHWQLGNHEEAYDVISRAIDLFESKIQFRRQRIFYLVELNLTQEAAEQGLEYLSFLEDDPDAYVTIGEALRRGGNPELAIQTMEMARIRFPGNRRVYLALAQAYLDAGQLRNAGTMVERAAASDFSLYHEAAEIFRRAGEYDRALFLNSMVIDDGKKTIQRFNVLMSMGRYEEALALEPRMNASGALDDDNLAYAVAYALFQTRQFDRAAQYTSQIESPELFRQATQLRRAIETIRRQDLDTQTDDSGV